MSEIRVTTVSDTAGTGPVTLTKQHAAKAWVSKWYNTGTLTNSFNVSSVTDVGTGQSTVNFSSSFSSANYSHTASDAYYGLCQTEPNSQTASAGKVFNYNNSFALVDTVINTVAHGDLA